MNLLITGAWGVAKSHIPELESMGHDIVFHQQEKDSLPCAYDWVEGVICNGLFLTHAIEKFTNLRYIQLTSAGFDRINMDYVMQKGIAVHNAKGVYSVPMAEHALAGVLALYRRLPAIWENQKKREWIKQRDCLELSGKIVVIVGCGSVGDECAKRFMAFGCHVIGVNRTVRQNANYHDLVGLERLDEVLPKADVVVLAIPLTTQTHHLMNEARLKQLKPTAILVNVSRGGVVDGVALGETLPNLGGAVLDVFEQEPLDAQSPLWEMKNVIVTPHNSFVGDGNQERLKLIIEMNIGKAEEITDGEIGRLRKMI